MIASGVYVYVREMKVVCLSVPTLAVDCDGDLQLLTGDWRCTVAGWMVVFLGMLYRYALDVHTDRAEDVLTHKRLLQEAKVPENRPVFHVRAVQVSVYHLCTDLAWFCLALIVSSWLLTCRCYSFLLV
jgi:hypothetical protein